MAGTWSTGNPPTRPGAYFNFMAAARAAVAGGVTGTAAIVGTADWGPENAIQVVTSPAEFEQFYGTTTGGSLPDAAVGTLAGLDSGGAAIALVYRAVGTAGLVSSLVLNDGAAAPSVTLTGKYKGVRGNNFTVTVQANVVDAAKKDLIIYETVSGAPFERERFSGLVNTNTAFVTEINLLSKLVTAVVTGTSGRVVNNVVSAPLAGGNSGLTLTTTNFTDSFNALEAQSFNTISLGNISDDTTLDLFVGYVKKLNSEQGKRVFGVIGGADAEAYSAALARSTEYDSENIINVGATSLKRLSDNVTFSPAQLASRIAGAIAGIGLTRSLTNVKFSGYQVVNAPSNATYTLGITDGILMFTNDSTSRVRVEAGVTSLRTTNLTDRPTSFRQIRNVAITHFIQTQLTAVASENYLGRLANSETARRDLVGNFLAFLRKLEGDQVLQGGSQVTLDGDRVQGGNAVYISFEITPIDAIERIFLTVKMK